MKARALSPSRRRSREPPASQDRRCSLRVHTRRGYGSDSSRASALATPVPCGAAPASHPPRQRDPVRRGAGLARRRFVMPTGVRGYLIFRSCSETDESDVRRVPAPRIPRPGKGQGYAPLRRRGCVATEKQESGLRGIGINPEPRLAAPGALDRGPAPRPAWVSTIVQVHGGRSTDAVRATRRGAGPRRRRGEPARLAAPS